MQVWNASIVKYDDMEETVELVRVTVPGLLKH